MFWASSSERVTYDKFRTLYFVSIAVFDIRIVNNKVYGKIGNLKYRPIVYCWMFRK